MRRRRILLGDDHAPFRAGVHALFKELPDVRVIGARRLNYVPTRVAALCCSSLSIAAALSKVS
jgi:DNA-binding NarL/FixJ family response regulator